MRERVKRFAQHLAGLGGHERDVDERLELRLVGEVLRDLGDVAGVVADALEVDDDVEHGGDGAQVRRHGLLQREQVQTVGLDEHVEVVDVVVGPQDLVRQLDVRTRQRVDGSCDGLFDQAAHAQHVLLRLF